MAAFNLAKHNAKYHKSQRAISRFEAYLKSADTSKLSAKSAEQLKSFNEELLPAFKKQSFTQKEAAASLAQAYELWKADPKNAQLKKLTIEALSKDKTAHTQVYLAEKIDRRAKDDKFKEAAKKLYTESAYFNPQK